MYRLSFAPAGVTVVVLAPAAAFGPMPDRRGAVLDSLKASNEAVAVACSAAARGGAEATVPATEAALARRDPDPISAGVRDAGGRLIAAPAGHEESRGEGPLGSPIGISAEVCDRIVAEPRAALAASDAAPLGRAARTITSMTRFFSIDDVSEIAHGLELMGQAGDLDAAPPVDRLIAAPDRVPPQILAMTDGAPR